MSRQSQWVQRGLRHTGLWPVLLGVLMLLCVPVAPVIAQDQPAEEGFETFPYDVTLNVAGADDDLRDALRRVSALRQQRREGAPSAPALIALAQGDYRNLLAVLYAQGYYAGAISIRVAGTEASSYEFGSLLPSDPTVVVTVEPGPRFRFGRIGFADPQPPPDVEIPEDFRAGRIAGAEIVVEAEKAALEAWRQAGHPKAELLDQIAIADHATNTLDVTIRIAPGPQARFGPVAVRGAEAVDPDFIRYMADIPLGARYDPDEIERAREQLVRLGAFRSVQIREAEDVSADGTLPITLETTPRLPRRYGFGATYSTIEGVGLEAYWLHRNLFGRAERLRVDGSVNGIGEENSFEDYDYGLIANFLKPGVIDPDTDLELELGVEQNVFETYTERKARAGAALVRRFSPKLRGDAGVELAYSEVEDDLGNREFLTASTPVNLVYDRRDDPLDPAGGYFIESELRPFYELQFDSFATRAGLELRRYFPIFGDDTVLALRGAAGTVFGGDLDQLPPDLLFFTGGGGSIRGFEYRSIGLRSGDDVTGGRSKIEFSAEVRHRISERWGIAAFVDGGAVSANALPGAGSDWRYGVGLGGRAHTTLGPIRLDVAVPLEKRPSDPSFALYIGIGQAF